MSFWHDRMHGGEPVHGLLEGTSLTAWHLGMEACDCAGTYAGKQGDHLQLGRYLCRAVHEDELRLGTFLGYHTRPDCKLQSWGHFRHASERLPVALAGLPLQARPDVGGVLAGDLAFEHLTRKGGRAVHAEGPFRTSGKLLLIDHTVGVLSGRPETVLWYSNAAYEARLPSRDRMLVTRVTVPSTTPVRFD